MMRVLFAVTVTPTDVAMIVAIFVLLLLSAYLAIAETGLTRMSKVKAQTMADTGRRGGTRLLKLVSHPERFLNPILLAVLVCQIVQATLTGIVAERLFGAVGVVIATFFNVVIVFVFAEVAPKTWAIQHTERAALVSAGPVAAITAFWPFRVLTSGLISMTNWILPGKGLKEGPFVSEEELLALAGVAVEEEVLDEDERQLIEQILQFGDTVIREVMVPRPDMIGVAQDFRVADAMEVVLLNGYSRLPVFGGSADDIAGLVFAKDLMRAERDGKSDMLIPELMRPAHFIPETKRAAELLPEMQAQQFHMAIVVDEYGGTAGLVTLEDLIEELVGEIVDEFDREEPTIEPLPDGSVRVNARMPIDEVNELLKADLPEGDWDTIGGLIFHLLGHIPHEGESVECDGHVLSAERVQGRRIGRVRITPHP
jgi:CBS domain containing-hemolysin-like protein